MSTRGTEPIVTVTYTCTPGMERRASRAAHPLLRVVLPWVTLVMLGANAILRGTPAPLLFGMAIAVGALVATAWWRPQRDVLSQLVTITFTRTGVSVDRADRQQSFPWSRVQSVGHRGGFWVLRLGPGETYALPESALDEDRAAALTGLLRGLGLLRG